MGDNKKRSVNMLERRFKGRILEILRHMIDFDMPAQDDHREKIWEKGVLYHGEFYGMDVFLESVVNDQDKQEALLKEAFSEGGTNFFLEVIRQEDETPPRMLLRLHLQKKTPAS